ncbi:hypothetical protein MsAg5_05070 [Methanosarcinaceae archaeon Ag5]|uniref:Antitoxin SocA-like Panacea domain-containing protein n=1 Tax=Methanolapillus africanus TaxID=3028297 RepID=A0AAE4MJ95_9EURY|nr:hypothetical protein [Methanosarcinaceae archaeon Ag5]
MKSAIDIGKWFVSQKLDTPQNTLDGNIKLQKLLFFAQLIHLKRNNTLLFEECFLAFTNGPVVESVRLSYKENYDLFGTECVYDDTELESLILTNEIFGDSEAIELVEISHHSPAWRKYYEKSIQGNYHDKCLSLIPYSDFQKEMEMIDNVLFAHEYQKEGVKSDF